MADVDEVVGRGRRGAERVDRHVGRRIREHRLTLGMTQLQLAEATGIVHQQVGKHEGATTRISAGVLAAIARALGVGPAWFFEGLGDGNEAGPDGTPRLAPGLARDFVALDRGRQAALVTFLRSLAQASEREAGEDAPGEAALH